MDIDKVHAGTETEDCGDEEREQSVSPCVSGVDDPDNQEFNDGHM